MALLLLAQNKLKRQEEKEGVLIYISHYFLSPPAVCEDMIAKDIGVKVVVQYSVYLQTTPRIK